MRKLPRPRKPDKTLLIWNHDFPAWGIFGADKKDPRELSISTIQEISCVAVWFTCEMSKCSGVIAASPAAQKNPYIGP